MPFQHIVLAALAALSQAAPTADNNGSPIDILYSLGRDSSSAGTPATSDLETRQQTCRDNGFAIFYPNANFGGDGMAPIFTVDGSKVYCTLFKPVITGPLNFKSYASSKIALALFKNSNCRGNDALIMSNATKNAFANNVDESGYLSFVATYI